MSHLPFWVAIPVVALLIPIAAIVADAVKKIKEREHMHLERLKAIEMGMTDALSHMAPPEPPAPKKNGRSPGRPGAVWTGLGAGLLGASLFVMWVADNSDMRQFGVFLMFWALPSLGVGIALLLYDARMRREREQ